MHRRILLFFARQVRFLNILRPRSTTGLYNDYNSYNIYPFYTFINVHNENNNSH